jgi:Txe/YoeB family toxin of Txe-Axe toxin-antitoxin module
MQEKLTILISAAHKKFIKLHARRQNKSVSKFIDDLLSSVQRQAYKIPDKDEWLEETAASYSSVKKIFLPNCSKALNDEFFR